MKIAIIGKGNVAQNLHYAFQRKGVEVEMYSSREGLDLIPKDKDVYVYAVRDEALSEVIGKVHVQQRALHLHTSGTMPIDVFGDDKPHAGVMYPFQTFSKERIIEDFTAIPVFVEAKQIDDISAAFSVALTLTPHVYETRQHDRERLHLAGVFVNNFTNLLYCKAQQIIQATNIPFEALLPLIDETAAKVHSLSPRQAQTGPARRRDIQVMQHHLSLLKTDEDRQLYQLLSKSIMNNQ